MLVLRAEHGWPDFRAGGRWRMGCVVMGHAGRYQRVAVRLVLVGVAAARSLC